MPPVSLSPSGLTLRAPAAESGAGPRRSSLVCRVRERAIHRDVNTVGCYGNVWSITFALTIAVDRRRNENASTKVLNETTPQNPRGVRRVR